MSNASSNVSLVIEGVRSLNRIADDTCDVTLIVDKNAPVSSVWDMLKSLSFLSVAIHGTNHLQI